MSDRVALVSWPVTLQTCPADPVIVETNPDENCSPEAFRTVLNDLVAGPDPELESIGAAEALRELRVDAGA